MIIVIIIIIVFMMTEIMYDEVIKMYCGQEIFAHQGCHATYVQGSSIPRRILGLLDPSSLDS